jgi:CRISPR-associated protein Cas2
MDILVAYDVDTTTPEGKRRLRRAALVCKDYGQRVQLSLFECRVNSSQLEEMEARLLDVIQPSLDSLRIYLLPANRDKSLRAHGIDRYQDYDEPLVF